MHTSSNHPLKRLEILRVFTPYAKVVYVAETSELVPGDLIFDDWDQGDFELVSVKEWTEGRTVHLERTGRSFIIDPE